MGWLSRMLVGVVVVWSSPYGRGQTATSQDWTARLKDKPLYLRGFWGADKLAFDGAGRLASDARPGPLSLSGVEVETAVNDGKLLVIHAHRVALVPRANGAAGLERRSIASTTRIAFSLRRGDKRNFHALEEMVLTVQPDPDGSFDRPIAAIFADGLADLTRSVPVYWRCYAASYFAPALVSPDAESHVERCVATTKGGDDPDASVRGEGAMTGPVLISSSEPHFPEVAAEMGVHGLAEVHLRIGANGVPVGLQVVRAVGAGVDEAVLQAVSQYRYRPATQGGTAVPSNMTMRVQVGPGS